MEVMAGAGSQCRALSSGQRQLIKHIRWTLAAAALGTLVQTVGPHWGSMAFASSNEAPWTECIRTSPPESDAGRFEWIKTAQGRLEK